MSPKLGRSTPTSQEVKPSNGAADLLGLDTSKPEVKNDDIFSSFFSAPEKPAEPKPEETKPDLKAEEENFFKQPAPSEKEKSRLTKDSILALYSQTPSTNLGNQFNSAQPAYQFGAYQATSAPYNNMPVQNGMQQTFNQFQPMNQFQQPFGPVQQPLQGQPIPFQQNNQQFFNQSQQSQQLPQQFGGLNLGQSFPNAFTAQNNIASNSTWQ